MRATYGDGENYIFNFAINWFWLTYLKATNQLSTKLMGEVLEGLNKGRFFYFIMGREGCRGRIWYDGWSFLFAILM